jgi:hypothetical protein
LKNLTFTKVLVAGGFVLLVLIVLQILLSPKSSPATTTQELNQEPEPTPVAPDFVPEVGDWDYPQLPTIYELTQYQTATFSVGETTSYTLEEPVFLVEIFSPQGEIDFNAWLPTVIYPDDARFELIYLY